MRKRRRSYNLLGIIKDLFQSYYDYVADFFELAKLEAKLAVRSLIQIAVLGILCFVLIISAWTCLLAVEYWLLITYNFKPLTASIIVFATNFLVLAMIGLIIYRLTKNLDFKATRKHLTTTLIAEKHADE